MVYKLECYHRRKAWIKGDLEAVDVLSKSEVFKTRKEANAYLTKEEFKYKGQGYKTISNIVARGDKRSELIVFTGNTWINENSGEKEEESFHYIVSKKRL